MTMDDNSMYHLSLVNPVLADKVIAAFNTMISATGNGFRVAQGLRTYDDQNALYNQGRYGTPGPIVTNARGGYSNHNFGCAVDCYPFIRGETGALDLTDPTLPQFVAMVAALKLQGLSWGGDWKHLVDPPHFQLMDVPVTPTDEDRAAFASGGLKAVWDLYI